VDQDFIEAIVHRRIPLLARWRGYSGHVVLGSRLRPFSLWHQQLLLAIDSPFLGRWDVQAPGSLQIFKQLYLATQICRVKPKRIPARSGWRAALWRKWIVLRFYFRLGVRKPGVRLIRLYQEAAKFRNYLLDYSSCPIPFPNKHSRPAQTPVALFQIERYRKYHPHVDERVIWGMSPGMVAWENIASEEVHGSPIEIVSEARKQAREEAIRRGAEKKNRKSANGNGKEEKDVRR
jgi:hypothetical protein